MQNSGDKTQNLRVCYPSRVTQSYTEKSLLFGVSSFVKECTALHDNLQLILYGALQSETLISVLCSQGTELKHHWLWPRTSAALKNRRGFTKTSHMHEKFIAIFQVAKSKPYFYNGSQVVFRFHATAMCMVEALRQRMIASGKSQSERGQRLGSLSCPVIVWLNRKSHFPVSRQEMHGWYAGSGLAAACRSC